MAYPIPTHRIHEIVAAPKCLRDGEILEVTAKGPFGAGFDVTLDLIDGPYVDLRYLGKAHDAARVEGYEANLILASGGNPNDPKGFSRAPRPPTKSDIADRVELVETYLGGTPLTNLFEGSVPFTIPAATRFEHHHVIAGSRRLAPECSRPKFTHGPSRLQQA